MIRNWVAVARALLKRNSESFRISVNTTNLSPLNVCLCVAQVCKSVWDCSPTSSWSGSSDAWVCELISFPVSLLAMMRDPQPSNLKPPHSSNIQLFTISCLPEICVFLVNVKIMQRESFMLNSEVMIYALFFLKRVCTLLQSGRVHWVELHDGALALKHF